MSNQEISSKLGKPFPREALFYEECRRHVDSLDEFDALHRELETVKRANLRRMEAA